MNKFEKVSSIVYINSVINEFHEGNFSTLTTEESNAFKKEWDDIPLPRRATKNSAGYDFFAPSGFVLKPNQTITIPTGIKCCLDEDKFLAIVPRSSLGFKYTVRLANTLGVIDADFFGNPSNEGHIFIKLTNESKENKELTIKKGEAFAQGIILSFYKVEEDKTTEERKGGIGSTNKK